MSKKTSSAEREEIIKIICNETGCTLDEAEKWLDTYGNFNLAISKYFELKRGFTETTKSHDFLRAWIKKSVDLIKKIELDNEKVAEIKLNLDGHVMTMEKFLDNKAKKADKKSDPEPGI